MAYYVVAVDRWPGHVACVLIIACLVFPVLSVWPRAPRPALLHIKKHSRISAIFYCTVLVVFIRITTLCFTTLAETDTHTDTGSASVRHHTYMITTDRFGRHVTCWSDLAAFAVVGAVACSASHLLRYDHRAAASRQQLCGSRVLRAVGFWTFGGGGVGRGRTR